MTEAISLDETQAAEEPEQEPGRSWNTPALGLVLLVSVAVLSWNMVHRGAGPGVIQVPDGDTIAVYVVGEVHEPGVVTLPRGSRVVHALQRAGGLTERADPMTINMAARVEDEQMLVIQPKGGAVAVEAGRPGFPATNPGGQPSFDAPPPPPPPEEPDVGDLTPAPPAPPEDADGHWEGGVVVEEEPGGGLVEDLPPPDSYRKVSVNRATVEELEAVPGIGPQLAVAIITFRQGPPARAFSTLEDLMQVPGIKERKLEQLRAYVDL